jgi:hypothetical protein
MSGVIVAIVVASVSAVDAAAAIAACLSLKLLYFCCFWSLSFPIILILLPFYFCRFVVLLLFLILFLLNINFFFLINLPLFSSPYFLSSNRIQSNNQLSNPYTPNLPFAPHYKTSRTCVTVGVVIASWLCDGRREPAGQFPALPRNLLFLFN